MTERFDAPNMIVVDDDDEFLDDAKRLFDGRVPTARTLADIAQPIERREVDLLVLGPSFATAAGLGAAQDLHTADPLVSIVLVASSVDALLLREAMRSGVRDVIEAPLTLDKMSDTLDAVEKIVAARPVRAEETASTAQDSPGKVVVVMGAKGGSGKTVTATNVAMLLASRHGAQNVVIVDADLQFGDVSLALQLEPRMTIVNAVHEFHRLDESLLEALLTHHSTGLSVLAAPLEPAFADEVSPEAMVQIISLLREMFTFVVVDTPSVLDERLLSMLERSDQVLFVVEMDLASVKNAKLAIETLRLLKFPSGKIDLVLNRSNTKAHLDAREIERSLKMKISAMVPSAAVVAASVNEGSPVVASAPKSKAARGFESVYRLVAGDQAVEVSRRRRRT